MPHAKTRYDNLAAGYERTMRPFERWFLTRWREEALSHLPADSRILEVGAGTGLNFRFYPHDARGVAGEISCEMLKVAVGKSRPDGIAITQSNAEALPFK